MSAKSECRSSAFFAAAGVAGAKDVLELAHGGDTHVIPVDVFIADTFEGIARRALGVAKGENLQCQVGNEIFFFRGLVRAITFCQFITSGEKFLLKAGGCHVDPLLSAVLRQDAVPRIERSIL